MGLLTANAQRQNHCTARTEPLLTAAHHAAAQETRHALAQGHASRQNHAQILMELIHLFLDMHTAYKTAPLQTKLILVLQTRL